MAGSRSSHRNSFVTRLKRSRFCLLLPGILGIIGCIAPINQWLLNGKPQPLVLKFRNIWLDLLTMMVWAITVIWTARILYPSTQTQGSE